MIICSLLSKVLKIDSEHVWVVSGLLLKPRIEQNDYDASIDRNTQQTKLPKGIFLKI